MAKNKKLTIFDENQAKWHFLNAWIWYTVDFEFAHHHQAISGWFGKGLEHDRYFLYGNYQLTSGFKVCKIDNFSTKMEFFGRICYPDPPYCLYYHRCHNDWCDFFFTFSHPYERVCSSVCRLVSPLIFLFFYLENSCFFFFKINLLCKSD